MKSRIFNLILFFVLFTFGAQAQVKGHEYYCWRGSLAKNIDCEIRMEHDNDHLALGEIIYYRKKGNTSSISLYGTIKHDSKRTAPVLYLEQSRQQDALQLQPQGDARLPLRRSANLLPATEGR